MAMPFKTQQILIIYYYNSILTVLLRGRFCEPDCDETWDFPANRLAHVDGAAAI